MDSRRALRWSGYYFLGTLASLVAGGALVAAGVAVSGPAAADAYEEGTTLLSLVVTTAPGLVLVLLGLAVYRLGRTWAYFRTFATALEVELDERYNRERVKSEVLEVLDGRLADLQSDLQSGAGDRSAGQRADRSARTARESGEDDGDDPL